jgi:hypothetical protein
MGIGKAVVKSSLKTLLTSVLKTAKVSSINHAFGMGTVVMFREVAFE